MKSATTVIIITKKVHCVGFKGIYWQMEMEHNVIVWSPETNNCSVFVTLELTVYFNRVLQYTETDKPLTIQRAFRVFPFFGGQRKGW